MNSRLKPYILLFILLLGGVFVHHKVYAQVFSFKDTWQKQTIAFEMVKNLIIVPVYINGKGPFNFILDTGVSATLILDSSIVSQVKSPNWQLINLYGYSKEKPIKARFSRKISAQIGQAVCATMNTIVTDGDPFKLSSYLGKKIDGIIGYSFFGGFTVRVNYTSKQLSFTALKKSRFAGKKVAIELIEYKPYIQAKVVLKNTKPQWVKLLIDCGASHALALEKLGDSTWNAPTPSIDGNLGVGIGGEINGKIARISGFEVGPFHFKKVVTNFPKYDSFLDTMYTAHRNGNLGAEILRRFTVTYDYRDRNIYLKRNHQFKDSFEHDMSGIEFYLIDQACYITRIEPQSPAQAAGLLPNDRIVSINLNEVGYYSLDQLSALFKAQNGASVLLEVLRDNKSFFKMLKLKRRI